MSTNLFIAFLITVAIPLHGCDGQRYDAVNPAVVTVCADGSKPRVEEPKGISFCPVK